MLEKLYTALYTDENTLYFNEDSGDANFFCNNMGILCIDPDDINFDNNFDENDPDSNILADFKLDMLNLKNAKHLNKR